MKEFYNNRYIAGNPQEVLKSIADRHKLEPTGEPSLQNAIEMARGSMRYTVLFNSVFFYLIRILKVIYQRIPLAKFS